MDGVVVGSIEEPGLLVLIGVTHTDNQRIAEQLASKLHGLRILEGERSAGDAGAPMLVVSQFTLYADTRKGRRPSWNAAAPAEVAEPLIEHLTTTLRALGTHVETGEFRTHMEVASVNDGPVTVLLDVD